MERISAGKWARLSALGGVALLMFCFALIVFEGRLPYLFPDKTDPTSGRQAASSADCSTQLAGAMKPPPDESLSVSDNAGNLRIVEVWPHTIRIGGRLCVVVAGVAPASIAVRLKKAAEDRGKEATVAEGKYDDAIKGTIEAIKAADASEKAAKTSPADETLKRKADNDREDLAKKEKVEADAQKNLETARKSYSTAVSAATTGLPAVELSIFLNERRSPTLLKAAATAAPQMLVYDFGQTDDAVTLDAQYWRSLVAGRTQRGIMPINIGMSRSQSNGPEQLYGKQIDFRVYWPLVVTIGALSMLLFFVAFAIYATTSAILRDHPLTSLQLAEHNANVAKAELAKTPGDPLLIASADRAESEAVQWRTSPTANDLAGTYSLGRTQMALWLGLSTAGFVFLWLTLGLYKNVITEAILVLLGINSATGLAAVILEKDDPKNAPPKARSRGFWADLASDGEGAKLQRIQVIVWTCILGVIFTWNVIANFAFASFDPFLLLLMGIANSTYLGFKPFEKPTKVT